MFVRGVIVDDEMDVEPGRYICLDMLEEAQEFLMTMTGATLGQEVPAAIGSSGDGASACCGCWIRLFSSTHSTTA